MTLWEITWTYTDDAGAECARSAIVDASDPHLWADTSRGMVPAELLAYGEQVGAMNYAPRLVGIQYATYSPVVVTVIGPNGSAQSHTIHDTTDPQTYAIADLFVEVDRPRDWEDLPDGLIPDVTVCASCGAPVGFFLAVDDDGRERARWATTYTLGGDAGPFHCEDCATAAAGAS